MNMHMHMHIYMYVPLSLRFPINLTPSFLAFPTPGPGLPANL